MNPTHYEQKRQWIRVEYKEEYYVKVIKFKYPETRSI